MPAVITRAITKNKIKTFKSNNAHSIDGFKDSNTIFPRKKSRTSNPTSLLSIGVSATIFEIPARFVNKSYPLIPIPLGNQPLGIPIGAVSPVNVVETQGVSSHPTNIVVVSVRPPPIPCQMMIVIKSHISKIIPVSSFLLRPRFFPT